jgi:hypothetical protein
MSLVIPRPGLESRREIPTSTVPYQRRPVFLWSETNTPNVKDRRLPAFISRDQLYYWGKKWQANEAESREDFASGNFQIFTSIRDAIDWLEDDTCD